MKWAEVSQALWTNRNWINKTNVTDLLSFITDLYIIVLDIASLDKFVTKREDGRNHASLPDSRVALYYRFVLQIEVTFENGICKFEGVNRHLSA